MKNRIWHPFTQMQTADAPLKVVSGKGASLTLENGQTIIDCISSWWVNLHGHAHPEIANAIFEQAKILEQVIFAGFTHQPAEELADFLVDALPTPLSHVFFSDNGSTAVEVALKMSFQYWLNNGENRTRFIGFEGGYHGDTVGAMSIGGGSAFWNKFSPLLFSIDLIPFPHTFEGDSEVEAKESASIQALEKLLASETSADRHAAICIEPLVQGAAGMRMCRPQFLQKLKEICLKHNILLIFDEVMTGFGRTGDFFASTKAKVTPDIICLSKGITGGFLPLSVTICSNEIFDSFLDHGNEKTFFHGHSYTANPLACAAAVASWNLLKGNQIRFEGLEDLHRKFVAAELQDNSLLENHRFCGTIFAAELRTGEQDSYFHSLTPQLKRRFVELGFLIRPLGNTIYLMPPYCILDEELESAYKAIRKVLEEVGSVKI